MERDSFVFYKSFYEAIKDLPNKNKLKIYQAIIEFALTGIDPNYLKGVENSIFLLIKPQILANNKKYENGKKGGRPPKNEKSIDKYEEFSNDIKPNDNQNKTKPKPNVNVNDNVNVNENVNVNVEVVEETSAPTKNDFSDLSFWHGEYSNVHLTDKQYSKLIQHVGKKEMLDGLIEDLSANIASKKENAPPYDENYPDMHYAKLKAYWDYRRLKGNKPKNYNDKQEEFKAKLKALADKYRVNDERERVNSG